MTVTSPSAAALVDTAGDVERAYLKYRAKENFLRIYRLFVALVALASLLALLWFLVIGADEIFGVIVFLTFVFVGGLFAMRYTAFGKTHASSCDASKRNLFFL